MLKQIAHKFQILLSVDAIGVAMPGVRLPQRVRRIVEGGPSGRVSRIRAACVIAACVAVCAAFVAMTLTRAQSTTLAWGKAAGGRLPAFEVASIKPNRSGDPEELLIKSGRYEATDATVRDLITDAYGLRDDQILGGPKWIGSKRYDLEAKVDRSLVESEEKKLPFMEWRDQVMLMLQSLLADRFKLKVRQESIQRPVYALVVAKGGPKMPKTEAPPPQPSIDAPSPPWTKPGRMGLIAPGNFNLHALTLAELADRLTNMPELGGRPVLDQAGLSGAYDFILHWTPSGMGPNRERDLEGAPPPEPNGPSLFSALQEQLGLRLVATRGPVYTVVIEHIEEPTAN